MFLGPRSLRVSLVAVSALQAASLSAQPPQIVHGPVGCIIGDSYPRLTAGFTPPEGVSRGRVRFKAAGGKHWYSVAMSKEGDAFVGVLPKPTQKLKAIDYYVEVIGSDFATTRTPDYKPVVAFGPGACKEGVAAGSVGSAAVILEVPAGAPPIPVGFSNSGVVVSAAVAVAAAGAAAGTGGSGIGAGAVILGGVAAAGAAAAIVATSGDPTSPTSQESTASTLDGLYLGTATELRVVYACWRDVYNFDDVRVRLTGESGEAIFNGSLDIEGNLPSPVPGLGCSPIFTQQIGFRLPVRVSGNNISAAGRAGADGVSATFEATISGNTISGPLTITVINRSGPFSGYDGTGSANVTLAKVN
jgi:hypothetical protein